MSQIDPITMNLPEFLIWNTETGRRHELIGGEVVPIAPMSEAHGLLASRLTIRIGMRARQPCQTYADAGLSIPERNSFYLADVVLTCAENQDARSCVDDPVLVVEVLSKATLAFDRGIKLYDYIRIPTVQEVLFVDGCRRGGQIWHRAGEGWRVETFDGNASVHLETTDDTIPLAPIYGNLDLSTV